MCGLSLVHIHNLIGPEKGIGHSLMWLNNRKVLNIQNVSHWNTTNSHRVWFQVAWKKFRSLKELFSIQTIKNQCLNEMSCYCNITLWIAISQYFSVKKYIVMHWPEKISKTKIQILAFRETFLQENYIVPQVKNASLFLLGVSTNSTTFVSQELIFINASRFNLFIFY